MDVNSFCSIMQSEINSLESRVNGIVQRVEQMKDLNKDEKAAELQALHALVRHLSEMNKRLGESCPLDWSQEKREMETKKAELVERIAVFDSGLVDN
jgi:cytochrome c